MNESRCTICKAELTTLPYSRDFVLYSDEKFYCTECLIKRRTASRTKSDRWSKSEAQSKIEILIEQTESYLTFCSEKEQLNEYIDKKYAPSYIPSSFYNKLNSIFQGTYKGLKRPVPPLDLLEMLQQKEGYLDKVAASKWGIEGPEPMSRVNWDIAIVLSKYDSFLNWKKNQEILRQEQEAELMRRKEQKSGASTIRPRVSPVKQESNVDIAAMLDELFD